MKTIYLMTTVRFGMKELKVGHNKGKKVFAILDKRTVGWFASKKDALKAVRDGDIGEILYECGEYPWLVVEEISAGLYSHTSNEWWWKWHRKSGKHAKDCNLRVVGFPAIRIKIGEYVTAKKPKQYNRVFNFGIG